MVIRKTDLKLRLCICVTTKPASPQACQQQNHGKSPDLPFMSTAPLYISFPSHYHELNPLRSTLHTSAQAGKAFLTREFPPYHNPHPSQTPPTQPSPPSKWPTPSAWSNAPPPATPTSPRPASPTPPPSSCGSSRHWAASSFPHSWASQFFQESKLSWDLGSSGRGRRRG